jgi:hypothetical protein
MRKRNREGKITFIELLLIAVILLFGYWVIVAPMSKTEDMVKEEWVKKNLSTMFDAIAVFEKNATENNGVYDYSSMTVNDVDILRARWERPPLEWPKGVLFDSFSATSNSVAIAVEFSTGVRTVTYVPQ